MTEPIMTKRVVRHRWVEGVPICSYEGAGSPVAPEGIGTNVGQFANIKK